MKLRGWIVAVVGLVVCLGAAYAAYQLADYSWNQVVDYRGPYTKAALPPAQAVPPARPATVSQTADLTVFVIVDGLREDVSRTMPNLENLRTRGYDAVVKTSQPSLSFPNWTTLLSGAPQRISGVTTNWFEEKVPVETLVDVAMSSGTTLAVSAPTDFQMLYDVERSGNTYLRDWVEGEYMTDDIVDNAIRLAEESNPSLLIVHFPDIDEAGHAHGGASKQYRDMALKVDRDLGRLVGALQGAGTTFVVAADHGHIATGGHGGPEPIVTEVPAVFVGPRVKMGKGVGEQDQVAPTVAVLAGLPIPRNAAAEPLDIAVGQEWRPAAEAQQFHAYDAYIRAVSSGPIATADLETAAGARRAFDAATASRLTRERSARLPMAAALAVGCLLVIVAVGLLSWRALVSAFAGLVAYYAVWDGSYFLVHGYRWSLSSFNSEALLKGFLNGRMTDAVLAGVIAAVVAALAYSWLHRGPAIERPRASGWLSLGAATVLVIQATLGIQVAWYLWWWGASVSWVIPDLALGFKYDLDLIQLTGLGAAAVLGPVAALLIGRWMSRGASVTAS